MLKNYLTCERYLDNYNKGEKTVVGILNGYNNDHHVCVTETTYRDDYYSTHSLKVPEQTNHYLVGPIADALHAYEELGYTPEELKKIIEEHKKLKARSLYISSASYGTLSSPFRKALEEMREAEERRKWHEKMFKALEIPTIESLYPNIMIASDKIREEMRKIEHLDEWAKEQVLKTNPNISKPKHPIVDRAIFNDPATIVFWKDGTKTVVKAQKGETYDPEKGLAMAFSKKMFGNEGNYYDQFTKLLPKEKKS